MTGSDELEVRLNGHMIPDDRVGRTASSDRATTVDSARDKDGRNIPCTAQGGRIDFLQSSTGQNRFFDINRSTGSCLIILPPMNDGYHTTDFVPSSYCNIITHE